MYVQLEQRPAAYDLQLRQDDLLHVHVADEDITRDLTNVLEETKVELVALQPRNLEVAVDIGAVCVAVAQVAVMVLLVRWYR